MKRGVLVATLAMTVAGIATVGLLKSASHGVALSAQAAPVAPVPSQLPVISAPARSVAPAVVTAPAPAIKASLDIRQAPVPLLVKPRPGFHPLADAGVEAPVAAPTDPVAADGTGSETLAKAAIEADGYKAVRAIRKGDNGVWYAKALRGKTEVTLIVDASGSVSAE